MYSHLRIGLFVAAAAITLSVGGTRTQTAGNDVFTRVTTHRGLIYVSGIVARPAPNQDAPPGDIRAQTTRVLDGLAVRLKTAGSSIDRVLTVTVYLKSAGDFSAMNEVWSKYWPKDPPARTTVVADSPMPGVLIQIAAIAAAGGAPREVIHPAGWLKSPSPYSYAVKSGDTLFLAGLVARRGADNTTVKGDISLQTQTTLDNANAILTAAGFSFDDVASSRVYLTDVANFAKMNETYRASWTKDPPARATVITGLTSPDYLVEITLTAVKGGSRVAFTPPNADGSPGSPNPNLSAAISVGPRLFTAGMLGILPGKPPDIKEQTEEILSRIGHTLAAHDAGWRNVIDSVVYITDPKFAPGVLQAFGARRDIGLPSGAVVVTGLVSPDARAEIMVTSGK